MFNVINKKIGWVGKSDDERLLPVLQRQGCTVNFLDNIEQSQSLAKRFDFLVLCEAELEDWPSGVPIVLYEPQSFTRYMYAHDARFAEMTEIARQAAAVVCCDEVSRQWWSCFNSSVYLLNGIEREAAPNGVEVRIAEMIAEDYLAGCSYAVRHRVGLWGKVKRYYKEFGLRQTLHRVYEKLSGQEDDD